jgi:hypothetical protein
MTVVRTAIRCALACGAASAAAAAFDCPVTSERPVATRIQESADIHSFLVDQLGVASPVGGANK